MISSEVQRTLVKSAPELWSELSDEATLGRHLSDFGAIRITRRAGEERVDWESGDARGSVHIRPSGWGTRVTLTVEREGAEPAAPEAAAAPAPETRPRSEPFPPAEEAREAPASPVEPASEPLEPVAQVPEPAAQDTDAIVPTPAPTETAPEPATPEPEAAIAPSPDLDAPTPAPTSPRRGFLGRIRSRWQRTIAPLGQAGREARAEASETEPLLEISPAPTLVATPAPATASAALTTSAPATTAPAQSDATAATAPPSTPSESATQPSEPPQALASATPPALASALGSERKPQYAPRADAAPATEGGLSEELRAAEEAPDGSDTAVLSAVLDSLGSAHHRPFSRS